MAAYFVDANVPMYSAGGEHVYKRPSLHVLRAVASGDLDCRSSTEVLQEILHRFSSVGSRETGLALAERMLALLPAGILSISRREIIEALSVARLYPRLAARDCVHLATMRTHGITDIISADRDFDGIPGITRHDPLALAARLGAY